MKTDTLIRREGMEALMEKLDLVDAERFITLIKKEPFDYTRWQETLYEGMSIEEICAAAVTRRARAEKQEKEPAL
jgi:PHD/YefM family antitoxin component YafN of YafNO toxin-antitoxin module